MRRPKPDPNTGPFSNVGQVREIDTRFGKVTETMGKWSGHYQSMVFEGTPDAVFWIIGQRLDQTSTCYEHTFQVKDVEKVEKGEYWNKYWNCKATCEWTSYVGD